MMPGRALALLCSLALAACSSSAENPTRVADVNPGLECVPYARALSGIQLAGDAWSWWRAAEGRYQRGTRPAVMAVLVFSRTQRLPDGHLAVVTALRGPREIVIAHANWVPGRILEDVAAIDVSTANDWTMVRVFNVETKTYGRPYPTEGFIYRAPAVALDATGAVYLLSRGSG
jgi:surface antigen